MSPFFALSDKGRDAAQRVVIFSLLVIFFSGFNVQLTQIPILNIPLPLQKDNIAHEIPTVASIFLLVAIFQFLVLIGIYIGEYSNYVELTEQNFTPNLMAEVGAIAPEEQQVAAALSSSRNRNWILARFGFLIRLSTDGIIPSMLIILAGYLQIGHSIRAIYQMVYNQY